MRLIAFAILAVAAAFPQQPRRDYLADHTWHPGGTPESQLWQVLVLSTELGEWRASALADAGDIHAIAGYRFEPPDRVLPEGGWRATVREEVMETGEIVGASGGSAAATVKMPKGVRIQGGGSSATRLRISSESGDLSLEPMAMVFGEWTEHAGGRVIATRIPASTDLSGTALRQHDFPSVMGGGDGTLSAVWLSYHDRREELNFRQRTPEGAWTRLIPVGRAREDLWRPHVELDAKDKPWLIWSERPTSDGPGNWDLYAMAWEDNEWGERTRLSDNPLPDIEPATASCRNGRVYVAWQALRGRSSQIRLRYMDEDGWSSTISVTNTAENNWEPSVACGPSGEAWVAWDRYNGDYNVYARSYSDRDGLGDEHRIAATLRFEAHTSVAVDSLGRPWVAWETDSPNWGKDYGFFLGDRSPGAPLAGVRETEIAVLDQGHWLAPAPLAFDDPLEEGTSAHSRPLLWFDPDGNLWLSLKRRYSRRAYRAGVHWEYFLTRLDGEQWTSPIPLVPSGNRKSTRMSLTAADGRLWAFWPHDNRDWSFGSQGHAARVVAGSAPLPGPGRAPRLRALELPEVSAKPSTHPNEADDVRVVRNHRVELRGETLRILRGDLHRHTELSPDQGGMPDGSLPEFYRYMIDAGEMDFGASTDHQAGGIDYWNFMTQKMADMYHFPDRFSTFYAYERNPGNPHGHRNMIYTHRNYPIVPFFQSIDPKFMLPDAPDGELLTFNSNSYGGTVRNDTHLLHEQVKASGGLAIPHTSGSSGMGTDWHAFDEDVDAVVEIYQGDRINNEHEGAPRWKGPDGRQSGGWQSAGQVWNAWKKGYKIGVIASSDHMSTHISYAMVYSPSTARQDIWDAIKRRHTYGATDNIVLEFRIGKCFMGEECEIEGGEPFEIAVRGTDDISAVRLIRDGGYIYTAEPAGQEAELQVVDLEAPAGEHWYYVRVEQADEELAWSSPIWVSRR